MSGRGFCNLFVVSLAVVGLACGPNASTPVDAPANTPDAVVPNVDAGRPNVDASRPDAAQSPADAPSLPDALTATGLYLDRCTAASDCVSGLCALDFGGTRFCSRACTLNGQCAHEHVCAANVCQFDDTGAPCSTNTPQTCTLGLCLGSGDGTGACTRDCASAADCPSGYACTVAGGSQTKICVNIEKPCASANNCGTGLCITGNPAVGCTAFCDSAADCPRRLTELGLPAYTCGIAFGSPTPLCIPPVDILGSDAIGAGCNLQGTVVCRSGVCADTNSNLPAMCTQWCSPDGGCAPGLGCAPIADGNGGFLLVCNRGGVGDLSESCTAAVNCHSGLCDGTGLCTRFCNDGLCPTGWTCLPQAGTTFSICRP